MPFADTTFPPYLEQQHKDWLNGGYTSTPYNVKAYLEAALDAGSPYLNAAVYDPNEQLDDAEALFVDFGTDIAALDATDVSGYYTGAAALAPSVMDASGKIAAMVAAYDDAQKDRLYAGLNMLCGSAFEARTNRNSQHQMALAMLFRDHARNVGEYQANLELNQVRLDAAFILQAAADYFKIDILKLESTRNNLVTLADLKTKRIVANREMLSDELAIAEADATWELELFKYGENMLHGLSGVSTAPSKLGRGQGAGVAGMMSAGGLALAAGTAVGGALGLPAAVITTLAVLGLGGAAAYASAPTK